jgi:hypothetical protein
VNRRKTFARESRESKPRHPEILPRMNTDSIRMKTHSKDGGTGLNRVGFSLSGIEFLIRAIRAIRGENSDGFVRCMKWRAEES